MKCAVEHDAGDVAPFLEGHVFDGLLAAQRRVVDEIVDAAKFFQRSVGHGVDGLGVDHVGNADHAPAALALDLLDDASASARLLRTLTDDRAAAVGQLQRHGAADAAAGAGDDGHAAGEFLRIPVLVITGPRDASTGIPSDACRSVSGTARP